MSKIYKTKSRIRQTVSLVLIVIVALAIIYGIWYVAETLNRTQSEETLAATEKAIVKSAVQCYALEGQYPTGLKYLEDNYGLVLNKEKYVYHYESIGVNMVPEVKVFSLYE